MAKTNVRNANPAAKTHEGGRAEQHQSPLQELRRTLSTCMLFEDTFYESGTSIASRLIELAGEVTVDELVAETIRAKNELHLRHAPLWMAVAATKFHKGKKVGDLIYNVIQRADELAEIISLYYKLNGRVPLSKQLKRGVANAFNKFSEYQLAKYNRDGAVKLRDVMFLVHPKPADSSDKTISSPITKMNYKRGATQRDSSGRGAIWTKLVNGTLKPPDTWEVALSTGSDKREAWEHLLREGKLGALALLRNLRNMEAADVDYQLVVDSIEGADVSRILPFQFVAAWRYAPAYARAIEAAMLRAIKPIEKLGGYTAVVVDVSGSMGDRLSERSDLTRIDAASALALLLDALSDRSRIWTFSDEVVEVQAGRGLALVDGIRASQPNRGTWLAKALAEIKQKVSGCDRVVVITDEQISGEAISDMGARRHYLVNVAPYQPGVCTHGKWTRINGFSQAIVDWIRLEEKESLWD